MAVIDKRPKNKEKETNPQQQQQQQQHKQEHDVVLRAAGIPVESDGQEHEEIMREIMGH